MASSPIIRVTMFKVPKKEDQDFMLKNYEVVGRTHSKDGKPYILSLEAGHTYDDARNQGYTLVAKTVFKHKEDFEFYDKECEAHKTFKAKAKDLDVRGMMMVYFTADVTASLLLEMEKP